MATPNFGSLVKTQEDEATCRRIYMRLTKMEKEITGSKLPGTAGAECESVESTVCEVTKRILEDRGFDPEKIDSTSDEWQEAEEDAEKLVYVPHVSHHASLVAVCVDALIEITVDIDTIENDYAREFLRLYYYEVKKPVCMNADAQAYFLNCK
jgi:hypothetical protein